MRLRVCFQEEQNFKVDLHQSDVELHSDFGELTTLTENNYENLINKPSINGVELIGNKTGEDLDLGSAVFPSGGLPGDFLGRDENNELAWLALESGTIDYDKLINRPEINGVVLTGNVSAVDLGLATPSDIPSLEPYRTAAEQDIIDGAQDSAIALKYTLPSGGIPDTDIESAAVWNAKADYGIPSGGSTGQFLTKASDGDYAVEWITPEPIDLSAYRTAAQQDVIDNAQDSAIAEKYTLPSDGIPYTDMAATIQSSLDNADSAYQKPQDGIPASDLSTAIQATLSKVDDFTVDSALSSSSTNPVQNKIVKEALDNVAAIALPSGGEAGQLLMKTSNVDYVTEWVSPAGQMEQDNTRPITSAAVYATVGNIQALLTLI